MTVTCSDCAALLSVLSVCALLSVSCEEAAAFRTVLSSEAADESDDAEESFGSSEAGASVTVTMTECSACVNKTDGASVVTVSAAVPAAFGSDAAAASADESDAEADLCF
jgi:hypothetical protein